MLIGIGFVIAASTAGFGQVIYDSGGFDASRFSTTFTNPTDPGVTGDLSGQDAGVNQWSYVGPTPASTATGTAQVVTNTQFTFNPSTQSVHVITGTANDLWGPSFNYDATGKSVAITWEMSNDLMQNNGVVLGQEAYIGINVFGNVLSDGTLSSALLAGAGVNFQNTQLFYFDGSSTPTGVLTLPNRVGVGWHQYELDLNYTSQTYQLLIDNNLSVTAPFLVTTNSLTGVDIATWVPQSPVAEGWGAAYIDNLVVAAVPEPSAVILGLLGLLALNARQRRMFSKGRTARASDVGRG